MIDTERAVWLYDGAAHALYYTRGSPIDIRGVVARGHAFMTRIRRYFIIGNTFIGKRFYAR